MPIIEAGEIDWEGLDLAIKKYLNQLFQKSRKIDTIILGCTHYALIEEKIREYLSSDIKVISQGPIIAEKLKNYLTRHPEIENKLSKTGQKIFLTTEDSDRIRFLAELFYGAPIEIKTTKYYHA